MNLALVCLLLVLSSVGSVASWSNGGYSADPSHPDYGTHDWIAQHALDWLPDNEKQYILNNLALYLYGTELPDNNQASDGIGDTTNHHVYYRSDNSLQEDNSAVRASTEFSKALTFLKAGEYADAAKTAGIMSHYIVDLAVFGHVMGSGTDWGAETHHSDYENYVNDRTSSYSSTFDTYLSYDGQLSITSAYDVALQLAYNTTFGTNGDLTCVWMDNHYDWSNSAFMNRAGQSLNLAVNYLTDVLHTLYVEAQTTQTSTTTNILINEMEQNPAGTDAGSEWVELYNPTSNTVDIGDWTLSTTAGTAVSLTIPSGTSIEAGGYRVYTHSSQWLDNEDESVILRDATGNEVDRTPILSDTYNDGRSWQRYPNGEDTNSTSDWSFRSSTMGVSNGGETKTPSSISISVSTTSLTIGASISISGAITPVRGGVAVTLSYTLPNTTVVTRTVVSTSDGRYSDTYAPSVLGSWAVKASWEGDSVYAGATSSSQSFTVSKSQSTISCSPSSSSLTIGTSITVSGAISPTQSGVTVTLSYTVPGGTIINRTVTTTSDGRYSETYTPSVLGMWSVKASWEGDPTYLGATSSSSSFTVSKVSSTVSCSVSPSNINIGSNVATSGSISPARSGVIVTLSYALPDSTVITRNVTTASDGRYSDTYAPTILGSYSVKASWAGDATYAGTTSALQYFTVSKSSSSISCSVSSSSINIGSSVTISGAIIPSRSGVTVTISYRVSGQWGSLATVTTSSGGTYSYTWLPTIAGSYQLKASWAGDSSYDEATSVTVSVTVDKIPTTISCRASSSEITEDDTITITGSISPAISGKTVTLTYTKPDGRTFTKPATTGPDGSYSDVYQPDTNGSWSVRASWEGDSEHQNASSLSVSFNVIAPFNVSISDTTSPVISSITPADGSTLNSTTLTISASYYDDVAINTTSVNLKVDGVSITPTALTATKVEYSTIFTEGTHSVSLTIKDTSGNTATVTWNFVVDTTPPEIWLAYPPDGSTSFSRLPTISATFYDAGGINASSAIIKLDSREVSLVADTSGFSFVPDSPLTSGVHTVFVSVKDYAGNIASKTWSFTVRILDTEKPVIMTMVSSNGSMLNNATVTISAFYSDNVAIDLTSISLNIDGVPVIPDILTASRIEYTSNFTEGSHAVQLSVSDLTGNIATASWSFTVKSPPPPSRCIIVTATYGFEIAPQVQFLRDFRETLALKTFAGSSFMAVFNTWYYSWSTPVAAFIAPDPTVKALMRVILEPLLYILQLSTATFSLFAFDGELAIVMAGLVASALIGLVYFMPITTIILIMITRLRRSWAIPKPGRIKFLVILWAVGIPLMFAGELTLLSPLMMFATGAFVVLTIAIVTGFVSLKIAELAKR